MHDRTPRRRAFGQLLPAGVYLPMALAGVLAGVLVGGSTKSIAHMAQSGWTYPKACCDDRDCRRIDPAEVRVGEGFYVWRDHRIAFDSPRVRRSGDRHFHGCEQHHWGDASGRKVLVCFFVPTGS